MIIGITGTNGAGKGTVVDYLVKQKNFRHYSMSGVIIEEIKRRDMPVNRDNTRLVGNDLRKMHGPGYLAEHLLAKARSEGGDAIIEALRTVGEATYLKGHGALLWGVDADIKTRYERITVRGSALDKLSFDHFCSQDNNERTGTDLWDMNINGVLAMADVVLTNNGTQAELFAQVEGALDKN